MTKTIDNKKRKRASAAKRPARHAGSLDEIIASAAEQTSDEAFAKWLRLMADDLREGNTTRKGPSL